MRQFFLPFKCFVSQPCSFFFLCMWGDGGFHPRVFAGILNIFVVVVVVFVCLFCCSA